MALADATEARIAELMALPYRKVIRGDAEQGYLGECPELPGCVTAGETEAEALEMLHDAMEAWLENALAHGDPIPPPADLGGETYNGRLTLRMAPALHRLLAEQAREQGIPLNQWINTLLAQRSAVSGRVA